MQLMIMNKGVSRISRGLFRRKFRLINEKHVAFRGQSLTRSANTDLRLLYQIFQKFSYLYTY